MLSLNVNNETNKLKAVIVGLAKDFGGTPLLEEAFDPTSKKHISNNTYPSEDNLINELNELKSTLKKHNVKVLTPKNLKGYNQIFARDVGFVIDDYFIKASLIKNRQKEIDGFTDILSLINKSKIINLPKNTFIEGGDVMPHNNYIFVGTCKKNNFNDFQVCRTNTNGVKFLTDFFPNKKIKAFELIKSDTDSEKSALHLDCCLQPIGVSNAIICKDAFINNNDVKWLESYFGSKNLINISLKEMALMYSNVFSISNKTIISEKSFIRLNTILKEKKFKVEEISYKEVSKMGGLLRCSTLPLERIK